MITIVTPKMLTITLKETLDDGRVAVASLMFNERDYNYYAHGPNEFFADTVQKLDLALKKEIEKSQAPT